MEYKPTDPLKNAANPLQNSTKCAIGAAVKLILNSRTITKRMIVGRYYKRR